MSFERERVLAGHLAAHELFAGLDDGERRVLARIAVQRALKRRQRLFQRGDVGDALVLVLSGRLDVARDGVAIRTLGAGALLGLSTIAGARHSADLVAAEPAVVLLLPGGAVRALFGRRPELPLKMLALLAETVAALSEEVSALREGDIEARTRHKVTQLARGRREVCITHAELARLVGGERANVSRALKRLEQQGVLVRRRGRLELR
jgi:CRP-like cAMP-binding protein